jgi:hypothetical protein
MLPEALQGLAQGFSKADGLDVWKERMGRVVPADRFVAHAFDELAGDLAGHGGHQAEPVGGEPGRQDGHGEDDPPETALLGVGLHHLAVGEDVGASDFDDLAGKVLPLQGGREVAEDVGDGDGLAPAVHPAGGHHDGKALHEVTDRLEGEAAGADDHRRPELRHRDRSLA